MRLTIQKRLAARVLKCSKKKIVLDRERFEELKESITKADIRKLIIDHAIAKKKINAPSRVRARQIARKKIKGQKKGHGSRKGKPGARHDAKTNWKNHIRKQRKLLKDLRDRQRISRNDYRKLYLRAKGGYFRNVGHLKMYIKEQQLLKD